MTAATTFEPGRLVRVYYPNGTLALAPVFTDGYFYGRPDVEAGHAVADYSGTLHPLDSYHEFASHTPSEILERCERTFTDLIHIVGMERAGEIVETLGTSELYTHFRTWTCTR